MPRRKSRQGSKGLSQYSRKSKRNRTTKGYKKTKSDNFSSLSSLSSDNESTNQCNSNKEAVEKSGNFSDLVDNETQKSSDVQVEIIPPSHVHVTRPNLSCAKKKQIARATTAAFISDLESENLGSSNSTVVQVTPLK